MRPVATVVLVPMISFLLSLVLLRAGRSGTLASWTGAPSSNHEQYSRSNHARNGCSAAPEGGLRYTFMIANADHQTRRQTTGGDVISRTTTHPSVMFCGSCGQAAGLSQEALAERAGVSARGVSDLERGARRTPHPTTVRLLVDALELGPADRQALLAAARPASESDTHLKPDMAQEPLSPPLPIPLTALLGRERELASGSLFPTWATAIPHGW